MELTKNNSNSTINYSGEEKGIEYYISMQYSNDNLSGYNGGFSINGENKGSFSKYGEIDSINYSFNSDLTSDEKLSIMSAIDNMVLQLSITNEAE